MIRNDLLGDRQYSRSICAEHQWNGTWIVGVRTCSVGVFAKVVPHIASGILVPRKRQNDSAHRKVKYPTPHLMHRTGSITAIGAGRSDALDRPSSARCRWQHGCCRRRRHAVLVPPRPRIEPLDRLVILRSKIRQTHQPVLACPIPELRTIAHVEIPAQMGEVGQDGTFA